MQNFYSASESFTDSAVILSGDEHFHATRSCRVRPGEIIGVSDGAGKRVEAKITDIDAKSLTAEIVRDISGEGEHDTHITLALALIKPANFELACEKCTELGVRRILPFVSARSTVSPDRLNRERLEKIVLSAAKQSGRSYIPEIADTVPVLELFSHSGEAVIVAIKDAGQDMEKALKAVPATGAVTVVIGPEGDFTPEELDVLSTAGAEKVSLSGLVLRAETAAITAIALAAACGGKSWKERLFGG